MVRKFTRLGSIIVILLCAGNVVFAQTITSAQSGPWNDPDTWVGGIIPSAANSTLVTFGASHVITVTDAQSVNSITVANGTTNTSLIIASGGELELNGTMTLGGGPPIRGSLVVNGVLIVNQGATMAGTLTSTRITVGSTGIYRHNYTTSPGTIYGSSTSWLTGSTLEITGYTTNNTSPSGLNQTFYNFVWNCTNQTTDIYLSGLSSTINGDFIVQSSNFVVLGLTENTNLSLTINGNLQINPESYLDLSGGSGNTAISLRGNLDVQEVDGLGNYGSGVCSITFSGTAPAIQNFNSQVDISSPINFLVNSNSILEITDGNYLSTGGSFTSNGILRLGSTDPGGALQLGLAGGNIVMEGLRIYASNSTIVYFGSGLQFIGDGFPPSGNVNLTIDNPAGVQLSDNLQIVALRTLLLSSGNMIIGNQTLTINGTVTGSGGIVGGPTSNLVIGGTGNFGTLNFAGTNQLLDFTLNRTATGLVTLGGDLTVLGTFTQTAGDISLNGNDLTISGDFARTAGNFIVNSASSLVINGSGTMTTVGLSGTALNTLTFDRSGATFTSGAVITVTNLNLLDGTFTNSAGFAIANGGTITRDAGTMTVGPASSGTYNLLYSMSGTISSGVEFSSVTTRIQNVTINGGGAVTLADDRTINGDLTLTSGDFNIGTNTVTLEGNLIANSSSTFTSGTFLFDGNTTISGSAIPTFGDIQVGDTRTLTLPSEDINVAGNILFDAGAIINPGSGTLTLTGGLNPQTFSGGGATLGNVTVNKTSGADVDLTSPLNITGSLRVASANSDFAANGNLVLISTSDGITDNGRIGALLNGATVSGNVIVERFMSAEGRIYRYISSPVTGFSVADLQLIFPVTGSFTGTSVCAGCTTNQSMFSYDGSTQAYVDFPATINSEVLLPGIGYSAFVRQDVIAGPATIDWTGPINQGTVSLPVSHNGTASSWNLVGNPYPSSIDWDNAGWTKTNISGSISVRDNSTGIFQSWNGATGGLIGGRIATGQGFWVRTTGGSPVLQVAEPVKSIINGIFFKKAEDEELNQFVLTLSDGVVEDNAYYWIGDGVSNGLDDFDAVKLDNFRNTGSIPLMDLGTYSYGEDAMPMAINSVGQLNCGDTVRVYTNDLIEGTYTLKFNATGFVQTNTWILRDKFLNTQVNVSQNPEYQFVVNAEADSKAVERFELVVEYTPVEITTSGNTLISSHETGNQWYLDGVLLPGETNQELQAPESGVYTLVTNTGACTTSADVQFIITGAENPLSNLVQVYPNPFMDRIRIEITSATPVMTRIYNPIGLLVMEKFLDGQGAVKSAEFDLSGNSAGLYILHIQKEGRTHQIKIVKSKE